MKRATSHPYHWLLVLIIVMTTIAIAIGAIALGATERRLVATAGENLSLAAADIADKLDRLLFERYGDVRMMSRTFATQMHDPHFLTTYLSLMKKAYAPIYLWLGVTDAEGKIIAATDRTSVGLNERRSAWFHTVHEERATYVGDADPFEGAGGVEAVSFAAPIISPRGEFLGTVTTRVGIPVLEDVVTRTIHALQTREEFLGATEYQFLTKEGDAFIDSDLLHKGNVNLKELGLPSARQAESSPPGWVAEEHLRRRVPVVTGYAQTQGYAEFRGLQWTVLVRRDKSDITAPIWDVVAKWGAAGLIVWGPMFVVLLWATQRLRYEWVQAQQESARARAAEGSRRESEEQTRSIVDTALNAVIAMDATGCITEWNRRAETMFGWSRQEAVGRFLSETIIPTRLRQAHERGLKHFLATGESTVLNKRMEMSACHRDGHEFPVELAVSAARKGDAYVFSALLHDITDRKRAERRLAAQYEVTRVLAESPTLEIASRQILRAIGESLDWELGASWSVDEKANVLRCLDYWHLPFLKVMEFVVITKQRTFVSGIGLPGRVWASGKPAWIPDVVKDANFPRAPIADRVGLHGAFGFPIKIRDNVYGVVEFFSHEIREPDHDLLEMVADIGIKIGQFVERKIAEEALAKFQERFRGIYESSKDAIGYATLDGMLLDVNDAFTKLTGLSKEELVGRTYRDLTPEEHHKFEADTISKVIKTGDSAEYEKEFLRKDRTRVPVVLTAFVVKAREGQPVALAMIVKDITERKQAEEQLRQLAFYDVMTSLPNRQLFTHYLKLAIRRAARDQDYLFAILFLDLDRFKVINDSLGHVQGDHLLQAVVRRLETCVRPGDTIARFGGDEFTILLDPIKELSDATRVADRIHSALLPPFTLDGHEVVTGASVGIAINAAGYDQPEHILRDADTALYRAKTAGRGRTEIFDRDMHSQVLKRLQLETNLRRAIERQEFLIYYQPIVSLESGHLAGFESLIRWNHPDRGIVSPVEFIPVAEDTGLIVTIGQWLLRTACSQLRLWQTHIQDAGSLYVSVNLSSKQFLQPDLVEQIDATLRETGLDTQSLRLEITETVLMEHAEIIDKILERLKARGLQLYLDDFGTGYSSLSYLHRFAVDALKIDQSFVRRMSSINKDLAIVRTIMTLARSLGIKTVAEGVETPEQLAQLRKLGCHSGQGYYFSKPVDVQAVEALLTKGAEVPSR